jgi:hypothetical protein
MVRHNICTINIDIMQKQPSREEVISNQLSNIILIVWAALGIFSLGLSIFCFARTGTIAQKILGVFMAILFGPFYLLYYRFSETYCKVI